MMFINKYISPKNTKPLVRWTVGDTNHLGYISLNKSIKLWKKIYGNKFDLVVCYNSQNPPNVDIPVIKQSEFVHLSSIIPNGNSWKLIPPRLRPNGHEIFIDNDLIIYDKINTIEKFLISTNLFFITEGLKRRFDDYDGFIHPNIKMNSGLFGMPPYFDLNNSIKKIIKTLPFNNKKQFNEQGLISSIVSNNPYELISMKEISVCYGKHLNRGTKGIHFVGINGKFKKSITSRKRLLNIGIL